MRFASGFSGLYCIIFTLLTGCATTSAPALLEQSDQSTMTALNTSATALLDGRRVTLGSNAFTAVSTVTLEPGNRSTALGRLATGRLMSSPVELQLIKTGRECYLLNTETGAQQRVAGVTCKVAPTKN